MAWRCGGRGALVAATEREPLGPLRLTGTSRGGEQICWRRPQEEARDDQLRCVASRPRGAWAVDMSSSPCPGCRVGGTGLPRRTAQSARTHINRAPTEHRADGPTPQRHRPPPCKRSRAHALARPRKPHPRADADRRPRPLRPQAPSVARRPAARVRCRLPCSSNVVQYAAGARPVRAVAHS